MRPHFVSIPTNGIQLRAVVEGSGPLVLLVVACDLLGFAQPMGFEWLGYSV